MEYWLPIIYMGIMGLALLIYVILDGYDLGVGPLVPLADEAEKDMMIASIDNVLGRQRNMDRTGYWRATDRLPRCPRHYSHQLIFTRDPHVNGFNSPRRRL